MRSAESQNVRDAVCEQGVSLERPKVHPLMFLHQECGAKLQQEQRLSAGIYSESVWEDLPSCAQAS